MTKHARCGLRTFIALIRIAANQIPSLAYRKKLPFRFPGIRNENPNNLAAGSLAARGRRQGMTLLAISFLFGFILGRIIGRASGSSGSIGRHA